MGLNTPWICCNSELQWAPPRRLDQGGGIFLQFGDTRRSRRVNVFQSQLRIEVGNLFVIEDGICLTTSVNDKIGRRYFSVNFFAAPKRMESFPRALRIDTPNGQPSTSNNGIDN